MTIKKTIKLKDFPGVTVLNGDPEQEIEVECGEKQESDRAINDGTVDDAVYERYGVDFDAFAKIAEDLLDFTPVVTTGLTRMQVRAFVKDRVCLVKKQVEADAD